MSTTSSVRPDTSTRSPAVGMRPSSRSTRPATVSKSPSPARPRTPTAASNSSIGISPSTSSVPSARAHHERLLVFAPLRQGAGDALEDVDRGDDAFGRAVLVDHDREVDALAAEHVDQAKDAEALGRRPAAAASCCAMSIALAAEHRGEDVGHVDEADGMVDRPVADQDAPVAVRLDQARRARRGRRRGRSTPRRGAASSPRGRCGRRGGARRRSSRAPPARRRRPACPRRSAPSPPPR